MYKKIFIGLSTLIMVIAFQNCGERAYNVQLEEDGQVVAFNDSNQNTDIVDNNGSDFIPNYPTDSEGLPVVDIINEIDDPDSEIIEYYSCGNSNNDKKVLICHIPPGNETARHTICISTKALQAHTDHHGDYMGPCK